MNKQYPKAIIFDLDDTILDTTSSADRLWTRTAERFADRVGVKANILDEHLRESREWYWSDPQRNQAGRLNLHHARAECIGYALKAADCQDEALAIEMERWFTERRVVEMRPFEGAIETLQTLKDTGVQMALISNGHGKSQREKVIRFELEPFFKCIILEGEFGAGKPDRVVFDHALTTLGVKPHEAWMVGDNLHWEVAAPQALGIKGVWVDWKGVGLPEDSDIMPDRIVKSIAELIA